MEITGSVALVTGANRGIGREYVRILLERGATVYAAARRPETIDLDGARPLALDITDPASVAAAAATASDVSLLVNNAGIASGADLLGADADAVRREMDTNFWGTLSMTREFAPVLAKNGGGAVVNMLSALSWFAISGAGSYHAAKAAAWALTNSSRLELAGQGTLVTGVHLGVADTEMTRNYHGAKVSAAHVVDVALAGVENGEAEVLVDDWSRHVKESLAGRPEEFYDTMHSVLAG